MLDRATLKLFINKECQVLISGGGWIEGLLKPIVNEIANLIPSQSDAMSFGFGIAAFHINDIVAIRQINRAPTPPKPVIIEQPKLPSKKYTLEDPQPEALSQPKETNVKK